VVLVGVNYDSTWLFFDAMSASGVEHG
jgi:hypothetical protein